VKKAVSRMLCLLVLVCINASGEQNASVMQITNGANSPVITQNSGPISVTYGYDSVARQGLSNIAAKLAQHNDSISNRLRQLIVQGDFESARMAAGQAIADSSVSISQIALLEYVQAILLMTDRRLVEAEAAMRAATSLQPANCTYMGFEGNLLVQLDRMAEAAFLVQEFRPGVASCMEIGRPFDRALLFLTVAMVSREHRDEFKTRQALESADTALSELALDDSSNELELRASFACDFQRSVPIILGIYRDSIDMERSRDACKQLTMRLGGDANKLQSLWAEETSSPWDEKRTKANQQLQIYSDALAATESLRAHPNLGLTGQTLRLKRAELLSDRGFLRLWSLNDLKGAHDDYEAAYKALWPMLVTQNADVWMAYHFLAGRMIHISQLSPTTKLHGGDPEEIVRNLWRLVRASQVDETMSMCEVFFSLDGIARQVSQGANVDLVYAIEDRHDKCLSHMADRTTLRFQTELYHSALIRADRAISKDDLVLADKESTEGLRIAHSLFGFPLDLEKASETFERIEQHAAVLQHIGNMAGAEKDFREVIELGKKAKNNPVVSTAQIYLASLIEKTDKARLREALTVVDEASDLRLTDAKGDHSQSCGKALLYLEPLRLATEISIERDDYTALQLHLGDFDRALPLLDGCSDVTAPYVSVNDKLVNGFLLQSLEEIGDAQVVKNALSERSFGSVHEAALSRKAALERAVNPYDEKGIPRSEMPILNSMLGVAKSVQRAR